MLILLFSIIIYIKINFTLPSLVITKQTSAINFRAPIFQYFHFGQRRFLSALLWIQTIVESDMDRYQKKNLNSWMYYRFRQIIRLDPKFYYAYHFGFQYLSIVKDDINGAEEILEKGLEAYPNDYVFNYMGGYHYLIDRKNYKKAIIHYNRIKDRGPIMIRGLISRLNEKIGQNLLAYNIVRDLYKNAKHPTIRLKYYNRLCNLEKKLNIKKEC